MLNDILDDDNIQVAPCIDKTLHKFFTLLLFWTLLPNLIFYLLVYSKLYISS